MKGWYYRLCTMRNAGWGLPTRGPKRAALTFSGQHSDPFCNFFYFLGIRNLVYRTDLGFSEGYARRGATRAEAQNSSRVSRGHIVPTRSAQQYRASFKKFSLGDII